MRSRLQFLIGGAFYIAFGVCRSFAFALLFLAIAHAGGSILWVFSTVLLQRATEDQFRGRVFAAELGAGDADDGGVELSGRRVDGSVWIISARRHGGSGNLLYDAGHHLVPDAEMVGPHKKSLRRPQ